MKIGYCRVSTKEQNPDLQLRALKKAGFQTIYTDKDSGAFRQRIYLGRCLKELKEGDVLVVWKLDRLGRSLRDLIALLDDLGAGRGLPVAHRSDRHGNTHRTRYVANGGDIGRA
jgi:DNA invertase Pin-like site-specific DNA recombinase